MRYLTILLSLAGVLMLAACSNEPERQWMKLDQTYTTAEFRRDLVACTKNGTVDDDCMKGKGWVSMTPPATKKPVEEPYRPGQQRQRL
jgi:hypothetical protein